MLELADYVKLDIRVMSSDRLKRQLSLVKKYPVATLAEKIETLSEFRLCQHLGFDYFQGYFLSRPEIVPGKSPVVDILAMTLLVERCQDPMADISGIARLVAQNASLSYRLLQAANSAMHGRVTEISSVKEAVHFLGLGFVSKLASLFLLSGLGDKPSAVLVLALQRGGMCEVLAADDSERNQLYLVGLHSALDFLLGQQIDSIIEPLPLSDEVKTAIVGRQGRLGKVLAGVVAYESQDWTSLEVDSEDAAAITRPIGAYCHRWNKCALLSRRSALLAPAPRQMGKKNSGEVTRHVSVPRSFAAGLRQPLACQMASCGQTYFPKTCL